MHIQAARHHNKRADAAITLLQDSTALVGTQDANTRSLNLDQGASTILNTVTGIPLVIDGTTTLTQVIVTPTPTPTPVSSSDDTSPTEGPTSSTSHGPSLTTVVAACVGAFIGAAMLIVSAVYLYKRYTSSQERAMRRRRAARVAEQQHNEKQRPNGSGSPPNSPGAPQIGDLGMGEKIDLSQPSPSMHSDFSHAGSAEAALAAKFTASQQNLALPSSRSPPTRQDTSWSAHSGTATDDSFLSLRSVSAPSSVAKTTPLATVYDHMHHAESAAVVVDPFQDESAELERAYGGPQIPAAAMTKAPRNGSGSSQSSNPFADAHAAKARAMGHRPHVNVSAATTQSAYSTHSGSAAGSVSSNPEQAMQNLIAALDLPPAQVEERLRVASMQPSIMSDITTGYEEIDAESFPLPPSSNGHHA